MSNINFNIEEAVKMYNSGMSTIKIAKAFGFKTPKSISDKLKAHGISLRRNINGNSAKIKDYRDDIFETIDCEWKSYYLGLLLTDGWITKHKDKSYYDVVGLSMIDEDVISFISNCTGKSYTKIIGKEKAFPSGNTYYPKDQYRILLNSRKIVEDLKRLSVVPNKTNILSGPDLRYSELKYLNFIMRGIIDGDGTFGFPSNSDESIYFRIISASEDFLIWCKDSLEILGMRNIRINKIKSRENFYELYSGIKSNIDILVNTIYKDSFGMSRKRDLILSKYYK